MPDPEKEINPDEALKWYVRLTSGHAVEEDWVAHADWLAEHPGNLQAFSTVQKKFEALDAVHDEVLNRYTTSPERQNKNILVIFWQSMRKRPAVVTSALAAAIALVFVAVLYTGQPAPTRFQTAHGELREITLADGSTVNLDTNTAITILIEDKVRTAVLDHGRAIFDIHHEADRPFLVNTNGHQVRVLGTKFEVTALNGNMSVAVARGSVGVSSKSQFTGASVPNVLKPGDKLTFINGERIPTLQQVDLDDFGTWTDHRLTFNEAPLQEVLDEVNRYFPKPVLRADSVVLQNKFTGSLYIDNGKTVAQNLAGIMSLELHQDGNTFVLEAPSGSVSDD